MKYVIVPAVVAPKVNGKPVVIGMEPSSDGKEPTPVFLTEVSVHRYLMMFIVDTEERSADGRTPGAPKIGIGYDGNRRIVRLDRSFGEAKPGDVVAVEDADWIKVKKIIEEKTWTPPSFGACFISFEEAWMVARDKPEAA
jgi:hypothetical protein